MSLSRPVALIVDDSVLDSKVLSSFLKRLGILSAALFSDRDFEVVDRIAESGFDICFVDLNVTSELSGLDVIRKIRDTFGSNIKVVVVSAKGDPAIVNQAFSAGADDFVTKPYDLNTFAAKLARHYGTKELEDFRVPFVEVPKSVSEVDIEMTCSIREITLGGILLESKSLFNKGSVVSLSGNIIKQISKNREHILVTLSSSTFNESYKSYCSFAEFEAQDVELRASVRSWLATDTPKPGLL